MATKPPDPYLQWLLSFLYGKMIDPTSEYYLPQLIKNQSNPTYDPYVVDSSWTVPKSPALRSVGSSICEATLPDDSKYPRGIAAAAPDLTLAGPSVIPFPGAIDFEIVGLSNVTPAKPVVQSCDADGQYCETANATAALSEITDWPSSDGLTIRGSYHIHQPCCESDASGDACKGSSWPEEGYGTFALTFKQSNASIAATAYTDDDGFLQVTVDELGFSADTSSSNVSAEVTIATITDPKVAKMWEAIANKVVSDSETVNTILQNVQRVLQSENTRSDFQKLINRNLKKLQDSPRFEALLEAPKQDGGPPPGS